MDTLKTVTSDPIARYQSNQGAKFDRKNRLRVMTTGEVFDTALRLNQRLGWAFLRLTIAPALFCLAAVGFVENFVFPSLFVTSNNGTPADVMRDTATSLALAIFVGGPLFLLGLSYSTALVVQMVSDYMTGKTPDPETAAASARRVLPRMFIVNLRELCLSISGIVASTLIMGFGGYLARSTSDSNADPGVIAGIGMLGFAVGGIYFLYIIAVHAFAAPIAVLENASASMAARRSKFLVKRFGYHPAGTDTIFSLYFLLLLLAGVVTAGIEISSSLLSIPEHLSSLLSEVPGKPLFMQAVSLIPSFVVIWTLIPIWATVITIVYYERRIRLEGYDIDALAGEISPGAPSYRLAG